MLEAENVALQMEIKLLKARVELAEAKARLAEAKAAYCSGVEDETVRNTETGLAKVDGPARIEDERDEDTEAGLVNDSEKRLLKKVIQERTLNFLLPSLVGVDQSPAQAPT